MYKYEIFANLYLQSGGQKRLVEVGAGWGEANDQAGASRALDSGGHRFTVMYSQASYIRLSYYSSKLRQNHFHPFVPLDSTRFSRQNRS